RVARVAAAASTRLTTRMALTDAQIERYSRQIILPEIGGTGQERLAEATVVLAGAGTLAQVTGRALAGCGIGHLRLATDAGALVASLRALNSRIDLQPVDAVPAGAAAASIAAALAAGLDPAALETLAASMRAARVPLVAAAVTATGGWLHVDDGTGPCALCASVSRPATPDRGDEAFAVLSATVLGSL